MKEVDDAIKRLVDGIETLGRTSKVDIIITGDHGMTQTTQSHMIFLDDVIDMSTVTIVDWSPVTAIIPNEGGTTFA